jgi:hypothetical protein
MSSTATPPEEKQGRGGVAGFLLSGEGWPYTLVPFIPIAIALEVLHVTHAAEVPSRRSSPPRRSA